MPDKRFVFELNQEVEVCLTGEKGVIIGRTQYLDDANQYLVDYTDVDGREHQTKTFYSVQLKVR